MKQIRRKSRLDFSAIMRMDNRNFKANIFVQNYRNVLDNCNVGDYIEAESMQNGGAVDSIIRNKEEIPVCYKIRYDDAGSIDYISADRVTIWEASGRYPVPTDEEYFNYK